MVVIDSFLSTAVVSLLYISGVMAAPKALPGNGSPNPRDKCWQQPGGAIDGKFDIPTTHPCAKANDFNFPSYIYYEVAANKQLITKPFRSVGAWNCCMACYNDKDCIFETM